MSVFATLSSGRICLRRWRDEDREAFAAMNSDARVMEFFRSSLSRVQSDAMVDGIEKDFSEHGFGLWAVEVPGVAPFIGFAGFAVARFSAPFTPCVEVGWRLAFEHWGHGYATEAARLALGYGFETLALPEVVSFTSVLRHRNRFRGAQRDRRLDQSADVTSVRSTVQPSDGGSCREQARHRRVAPVEDGAICCRPRCRPWC